MVGCGSFGWRETVVWDDRFVCLSPRGGEMVWGSEGSLLECGRRLPSVCLLRGVVSPTRHLLLTLVCHGVR